MNDGTVRRSPAAEQERVLAAAFADRLDALRHERGLTQEALARAAGLTPPSLARIRTAPRKVHLSLIQRVCRALNVTYDDLLSGLPEVTERYTRANRAGISTRHYDLWPETNRALVRFYRLTRVLLGKLDPPLISAALAAVLEDHDAIELVATDIEDTAMAKMIADVRPGLVLLDEQTADKGTARTLLSRFRTTRFIVLTFLPPSARVTEVVREGAGSLNKRALAQDMLAIILATARGAHVIARCVDDRAPSRDHSTLTSRELEVLAYVEAGKTNRQIAQLLYISPRTVAKHTQTLYGKLEVKGRRDLMRRDGAGATQP